MELLKNPQLHTATENKDSVSVWKKPNYSLKRTQKF